MGGSPFLGIKVLPDEKWNLSPAVLKTLLRRLLFENDNPLYLLKQRIVNYMYGKFQVKGMFASLINNNVAVRLQTLMWICFSICIAIYIDLGPVRLFCFHFPFLFLIL